MFQVDLSYLLETKGFQVNKNAKVEDGRLRVKQELMFEGHKIITHFILILKSTNEIQEATCNIESIYHNEKGWEEFNKRVTKLLKDDCCRALKGTKLPIGRKGAAFHQD